jgi:UDP-glucose 4-epimerase
MKEMNVIGTMQLLAACQKSASVRQLVVKSSTAVYGSSSRDPALFTEEMEPRSLPRSGYAKDSVEVEGYVRGFARRRPDVSVAVLRFTDVIGPGADSLLLRYLRLPVVPTVLGFDPRVQLLHADDALAVLRLATKSGRPGTVNVGGGGVLLLSQMVRRAGRVPVPVPAPVVYVAGGLVRRAGLLDFSREQLSFLEFGRVVDTTRLRTEFGYTPRYDTVAAFDDVVRDRRLGMRVPPAAVRRAEGAILDAVRAAAAAGSVGARRG